MHRSHLFCQLTRGEDSQLDAISFTPLTQASRLSAPIHRGMPGAPQSYAPSQRPNHHMRRPRMRQTEPTYPRTPRPQPRTQSPNL